jgi:chromosome partitioning protein
MCGQKGGSGKTTTAICVASELVARGIKTLVADADPQGTFRTFGEVATEANQPVPTIVGMGKNLARADQLPALASQYDVTIIDCPPRLDDIQRAAMMIANIAIIPCSQSGIEAWGAKESAELVQSAQQINQKLFAAMMLTRVIRNTTLGKNVRENLAPLDVPILASELGFLIAYQEAPAAGMGVAQYAPNDAAAAEVRALTDELLAISKKGKRRAS